MSTKITKGNIPTIGVAAMISLFDGWEQRGDSIETPIGYNVYDYFNSNGEYLGPDEDGIEPFFRNMTEDESAEFTARENTAFVKSKIEKNAFLAFKLQAIKFLAVPVGSGQKIMDEIGRNYGAWLSVDSFKKKCKEVSLEELFIGTAEAKIEPNDGFRS